MGAMSAWHANRVADNAPCVPAVTTAGRKACRIDATAARGRWVAPASATYNMDASRTLPAMPQLEDLAERVDRLVLRHEELKRTNALLAQQVAALSSERDGLRSRLGAARARIDVLLERLPSDGSTPGVTK